MKRLFALAISAGAALACGANTGSHANEPQRTVCFSSMECASYMKCVKGPNAINGQCRQLTEPEADAGGADGAAAHRVPAAVDASAGPTVDASSPVEAGASPWFPVPDGGSGDGGMKNL